jgi:hypothetical protein
MLVLGGVVCFAMLRALAMAQAYRGDAVPVMQRVSPVEFYGLRFLTAAFGREGPMDAPLPTPPVSGREYLVEADVSGVESVASLKFELLDANGRALRTLTMWRASDGSTDGEFHGFVTVPNQPFRVAVTGTTIDGAAIRSVLGTLFQPAAGGPSDPWILPAGIPANQKDQIQRIMETYHQELRARAAQAVADHPGGLIALPRAVVSPIAYEPLTSTSGAQIGIRLRYSIRFPAQQTITAIPHAFPVYQESAWRGMVTMKPLTGTITPMPQMVGVQSLQDVIVYQAAATYRAGVTYNFIVDMTPDFIFQGSQTGRFCIHEQKFTNRAAWNALIASQAAVPYSVTIRDTGTIATIPAFLPQRTFHENFIAAGAFDCGQAPNIRF